MDKWYVELTKLTFEKKRETASYINMRHRLCEVDFQGRYR